MYKALVFFAFFLSISVQTLAYVPNLEDSASFLKQLKAQINEPALIRPGHITFPCNFIWLDSIGYFNHPGTNYLFKLTPTDSGLIANRLDHSIYHGNNFHNYLFWHKGILYSFGGSGLFNSFFGLTYFDFSNGEWWYKPIENLPANKAHFYFGWVFENNLYCFYTLKEERKNPTINFGKISLTDFSFTKIASQIEKDITSKAVNLLGSSSENEKFSLFLTKKEPLILNKKTGEKVEFKLGYHIKNQYPFHPFIFGDSLYYYPKESTIRESIALENIDYVRKTKVSSHYPENSLPTKNNWWLGLGAIFLLGLPLVIWRIRRKKPKELTWTEKLKPYAGQALTRDQLDKIFELTEKSLDTAKTFRSKYITEINKEIPNAIERVPDPEDRRSYLYKINV